jgi:hypothetical protein
MARSRGPSVGSASAFTRAALLPLRPRRAHGLLLEKIFRLRAPEQRGEHGVENRGRGGGLESEAVFS